MSTFETFVLGLEVTGMGMVLVFLTLIIVMACIWGLDKLFPAKKETEAPDAPIDDALAVAPQTDLSGEAAAIVTAILLERQRQTPTLVDVDNDDDILGEVVTVVTMDPGQGTWKGYGRMQAQS